MIEQLQIIGKPIPWRSWTRYMIALDKPDQYYHGVALPWTAMRMLAIMAMRAGRPIPSRMIHARSCAQHIYQLKKMLKQQEMGWLADRIKSAVTIEGQGYKLDMPRDNIRLCRKWLMRLDDHEIQRMVRNSKLKSIQIE